MSFLSILVRKGRESLLPTIMEEASGLIRAMRNVKVAEVRTAVPMNDAIRERVTAALKKMHEGEVELNEQVDASLIGGFQLFMDNRMIDASIKREIDLLRRHINDHDYEPEF
jgi:F-type H+-transporting ATPase subunit delta